MIKSHEQALELRLPRIGVIRKGAPKPERGPGKDLDYFRLDRAEQSVVDAWGESLGKQPKTISGILPYADPAECLSIWDELWQGKRMLWRGDGERLHVKLDNNAYVRFAPGEGPKQPAAAGQSVDKLKVARISHLRILLPQLRIAGIFEIMSSSTIDADELWSNLMWIKSTVATLQGAPVTVFRAARQFNVAQENGNTMLVTKHMLHMMLDGRYLDALLPSPAAGVKALAPVQPPPALTSGIEDDAPEDAEWESDGDGPGYPTGPEPPATTTNSERVYTDGTPVHSNLFADYDAYLAAHDNAAPNAVAHLMNWKRQQGRNGTAKPAALPLETTDADKAGVDTAMGLFD